MFHGCVLWATLFFVKHCCKQLMIRFMGLSLAKFLTHLLLERDSNVSKKTWRTQTLLIWPSDLGSKSLRDGIFAHYCVVRNDVPLGVLAAQLLHAAGESSPGNLPSGTIAVALSAEDEIELLRVEQRLLKYDIPHVSIREPDAPFYGELMAIGIKPGLKSQLRKHFSNLKLIR